MTILRDSVHIEATPDEVFEWFKNLETNYRDWHKDHVKWEFLDGFQEGSGCYCEEFMHGKLHRMKGRITTLSDGRLMEYRFDFPTSMICPGGSFIIEPDENGCTLVATLSFRFGGLLSRFAKERMDSMREHMMEEGLNLKEILERPIT